MRNLRNHSRTLVIFSLLVACAHAGWAQQEWRDPLESVYEIEPEIPGEPAGFSFDSCSCLHELRSCLVRASLNLGRCLGQAHSPARQALCYLKFELDILLCLDRAASCELTCVP